MAPVTPRGTSKHPSSRPSLRSCYPYLAAPCRVGTKRENSRRAGRKPRNQVRAPMSRWLSFLVIFFGIRPRLIRGRSAREEIRLRAVRSTIGHEAFHGRVHQRPMRVGRHSSGRGLLNFRRSVGVCPLERRCLPAQVGGSVVGSRGGSASSQP